ncbi:uncharacterized protein LOC133729313 isoform X2 [Rosa rugosa]|uniref:uncharacterized protein LOC133729313 isoform X2 n=1 Tax=Rosa rugosa TaxID=74645 RepID=UPI002B414AD2|nr:uncharacterized protein LOC133729313 isoform X2 [Rosa rugosa]
MDCKAIQEGDPCSKPNDLLLYASFAMNAYYQARGRHYWNCDFGNSGLISLTDPSYGNCTYEGGETAMDDSNSGNWCVASPSASDDQLQANIEFACGKVDCSIIRSGDACFEPNTVKNRASIAVNLYYHQTGQSDTSCDFNGSGNIVRTDPRDGHTPSTEEIAKTWCVPNPSLTYTALQDLETYACNYVDCSSIHSGGPCFNPSNAFSHAAFAMNAYYHDQHQCFGNGSCYFAGREETVSSAAALSTWCVAKPTATDNLLQLNIDFACSHVNCSVIEPRGECQLPDAIMNHASVAMNLYYQSFGRTDMSCYFQSTGMVVIEDPSSGTCVYEGVFPDSEPAVTPVPANLNIKKGKSRAFSATSVGVMVMGSIIGCALVAVAIYVMLWLRQPRPPVVKEVHMDPLPQPLYQPPEPSASPAPVEGSY